MIPVHILTLAKRISGHHSTAGTIPANPIEIRINWLYSIATRKEGVLDNLSAHGIFTPDDDYSSLQHLEQSFFDEFNAWQKIVRTQLPLQQKALTEGDETQGDGAKYYEEELFGPVTRIGTPTATPQALQHIERSQYDREVEELPDSPVTYPEFKEKTFAKPVPANPEKMAYRPAQIEDVTSSGDELHREIFQIEEESEHSDHAMKDPDENDDPSRFERLNITDSPTHGKTTRSMFDLMGTTKRPIQPRKLFNPTTRRQTTKRAPQIDQGSSLRATPQQTEQARPAHPRPDSQQWSPYVPAHQATGQDNRPPQQPWYQPVMQPPPSWMEDFTRSMAQSTMTMAQSQTALLQQSATMVQAIQANNDLVTRLQNDLERLAIGKKPTPPAPDKSTVKDIRPEVIGKFAPTKMPDTTKAYLFVECIRYAVAGYGEDRVRPVIRMCLDGSVAQNWFVGLDDIDKYALQTSSDSWIRLINRDFMDKPGDLMLQAYKERFSWDNKRTPSDYVSRKVQLMRMAGTFDERTMITMIHDGFREAPSIHMALNPYISTATVPQYREQVILYQDSARLLQFGGRSRESEQGIVKAHMAEANVALETSHQSRSSTPRSPTITTTADGKKRRFPRRRPCVNYREPECGGGAHWDDMCPMRGKKPVPHTRAYYVEGSEAEYGDVVETDPDLEELYRQEQDAFFCFFGATFNKEHSSYPRPRDLGNRDLAPAFFAQNPKGPEKPTCRSCKTDFDSRSSLHRHLKDHKHFSPTSAPVANAAFHTLREEPELLISTAPPFDKIGEVLPSYTYAKLMVALTPGTTPHIEICADTGYGNSGISRSVLEAIPTEHAPRIIKLEEAYVVRGIGGGVETISEMAELDVYMYDRANNRMGRITRAFYIFSELSCNMLMGNDVMEPEKMSINYQVPGDPKLILGAFPKVMRIDITVSKTPRKAMRRVVVRTARAYMLAPGTALNCPIKIPTALETGLYRFRPSRTRTGLTTMTETYTTPHAVISHDQKSLLLTNYGERPAMVYSGTVLGTIVPTSHDSLEWKSATEDASSFFVSIFEGKTTPAYMADDSKAEGGISAKGVPVKTSLDDRSEPDTTPWEWPGWLDEIYVPTYKHGLPPGIKVPDVTKSTYEDVKINMEDRITPEQVRALKALTRRHQAIFSDELGCVREPEEDWLRIRVDPEIERKMKSRPPFRVSKDSEAVIDEVFDKNRACGRIEDLKRPSPMGLQVFVVKDAKGKKRPVVDSRPLNDAVAGDAYPLPRQDRVVKSLIDQFWLGSVDMASSFYQRILHPDDRHRAAVVTHRGQEQFAVSLMGYKCSVQHLQKLMDRLFKGLSWRIVACYVDDIIFWGSDFASFLANTDEVFSILSDAGITLKASKAFLGFHSLDILGYLVDRLGLTTTEAKAEAVSQIPFPKNVTELEHFIGLANWNRHLIPYFAQRIGPLQEAKTRLLKGGPIKGRERKVYANQTTIPEEEVIISAFEDIRSCLASRPHLYHFRADRPVYAFLDSSKDYGTGLAVYQSAEEDSVNAPMPKKTDLRPIHFMSRKLTDAETRYWPTDAEMSGLVWSVKCLRPYLEQVKVVFVTDHEPSISITQMKQLATTSTYKPNLRQQSWAVYLSQFWDQIEIRYQKGVDLGCPDALSRLKYEASETSTKLREWCSRIGKEDTMEEFEITESYLAASDPTRVFHVATTQNGYPIYEIQSDELNLDQAHLLIQTTITLHPDFEASIKKAYARNTRTREIRSRLSKDGVETTPGSGIKTIPGETQFTMKGELLYFNRDDKMRLFLPTKDLQKEALRLAHDENGHMGYKRSFDALSAVFYWPSQGMDVMRYIAHCQPCLTKKTLHHKPYGELRSITTPPEVFHTMTLDLITDLPGCLGPDGIIYDAVMTVTCKHSRAVRFIPGRKDFKAWQWAERFMDEIVYIWGFPEVLITDRDKRFLGEFWSWLFTKAGCRGIATTAHHPAADGASERFNQTLEIMLRFYVDFEQGNWKPALKRVAETLNNQKSATTGFSPHEIMYGKKTRTYIDLAKGDSIPGAAKNPGAATMMERRILIGKQAQDAIYAANMASAAYYNDKHEKPRFDTGYAYISLKTGYTLPSIIKKKLAMQRMGPFKVIEKVGRGNALRLELPPHYKIHDVISIVHLEPAPPPGSDPFGRVENSHPEPVVGAVDDETAEWEIEKIIDSRVAPRRKSRKKATKEDQYRVRWKGYGEEHDSWEWKSDLDNALEVVTDYEAARTKALQHARS